MAFLWLAVALAFAVGEVVTLAFYAIFVVAGALAAAAAAGLGVGFGGQVAAFAGVSLLGVIGARPPLMHYLRRRDGPIVKSGAEAMVGMQAPVTDAIVDSLHPGHVQVQGESWPALTDGDTPIPAGSTVRVVGLRQASLVVEPVAAAAPTAAPAELPVPGEG